MGIKKSYYKDGFTPDQVVHSTGLIWLPVAATTKIEKGSAVHDNGSGYAVDTVTGDTTGLMFGIAIAEADNTSGAAGDIKVGVIPVTSDMRYWVPNGGAVFTQASVGDICDLLTGSAVKIDSADTSITAGAYGFKVEEIDISADAVAVNTGGYARGRFLKM